MPKGTAKGGKTKDPNAPKRPMSAYFLWLGQNRASITKEGMSVTDVSKKAGAIWRGMSDAEKKPWEAQAVKAKENYEKEKAKYDSGKGKGK